MTTSRTRETWGRGVDPRLISAEIFAPLDLELARTLSRLYGELEGLVELAVAAASRAVREGEICLDLRGVSGRPIGREPDAARGLRWPMIEEWRAVLVESPLVSDGAGPTPTPLILDSAARLYLRRYWQLERRLAAAIGRMATEEILFPRAALGQALEDFYGTRHDAPENAAGVRAITRALGHRLTVVTGGPGTGKTTVALGILTGICRSREQASGDAPPRVALLAPTGKAAARMAEVVERALRPATQRGSGEPSLPAELAATVDIRTATVHRALGASATRAGRFRRGAERPLEEDLIIVDEASMVDATLMWRLLSAVPAEARLVLLGDHRQLASVEAGLVLADICAAARRGGATRDAVVELEVSHRFDAAGGIGLFAEALRRGDEDGVVRALGEGRDNVRLITPKSPGDTALVVEEFARRRYLPAFALGDVAERLADFKAARILCAHRRGPSGSERIVRLVEDILWRGGAIDPRRRWYDGRLVMVTRNAHEWELYNGDTAVVCRDADDRIPGAFFAGEGGTLRRVPVTALEECETAWATTVHKSQGSELDHVLVLLPRHASRMLTRELLYTAVTRARKSVAIVGTEESLRAAVRNETARSSGLGELLGG